VATTWALYALTKHRHFQTKLQEELLAVSTDNPTMDELNALPYLDAIVRETLRLYAPVAATLRIAMTDDIVPLDTPVVDRTGKVHEHIR
jgi:cytochrome P450